MHDCFPRRQSVRIGGDEVISDYDPGPASFAVPACRTFERRVDDGILGTEFLPERATACSADIEVERVEWRASDEPGLPPVSLARRERDGVDRIQARIPTTRREGGGRGLAVHEKPGEEADGVG